MIAYKHLCHSQAQGEIRYTLFDFLIVFDHCHHLVYSSQILFLIKKNI